MLFNSPVFVLLFAITFGLYYIPYVKKQQVLILILSSLVFYAYDKLEFVLLLLTSASINIFTSYFIVYGKSRYKKILATTGLVLNIGILIFFKYSPLVSKTLFDPSHSIGEYLLYLPLPIGISFFTFEGISLVIDVWKEKYARGKDLVDKSLYKHSQHTLFFISFFPHLIAGPILKAHDFYPQIKEKLLKDINWQSAFKTLTIGYFLKMVVADNLKDFTLDITFPVYTYRSTVTLLTFLFGYSCQIFADFAGYSLIAIGLAKLFGYDFNQNFNFPYIATSFKDFWKRWHMSLSSFLMEYLYFPLGGNRKGKLRTYINLIITMTLGGLWHGVAWSYALWGLLHGCALATERFLTKTKAPKRNFVLQVLNGIFVFVVVSFFWLFFKLPDINHVFGFLKALRTNIYMYNDMYRISYTLLYSLPVVLYHAIYLLKRNEVFNKHFYRLEYILYGLLLFFIFTNSGTIGSFIYFQF